jgi:hypothetical protein
VFFHRRSGTALLYFIEALAQSRRRIAVKRVVLLEGSARRLNSGFDSDTWSRWITGDRT